MSVIHCIVFGSRSRKSLVNQRSIVPPTIACRPFLLHDRDAVVPDLLVLEIGRGVGEDQPVDALRRVGAEPHADHAAHREAAPVGLVRPWRRRAPRARRGRASPCCRGRPARRTCRGRGGRSAAGGSAASSGAHLPVPHVQRGAERIAQHQHRLVLRPFDFVMDRAAVRLDWWASSLPKCARMLYSRLCYHPPGRQARCTTTCMDCRFRPPPRRRRPHSTARDCRLSEISRRPAGAARPSCSRRTTISGSRIA